MAEQKRTVNKKGASGWATPSKIVAEVLLESKAGALPPAEAGQVKTEARKKIIQLTKRLGRGGVPLRAEVIGYLEALTSKKTDARDGLSNIGVAFSGGFKAKIEIKGGDGDTEKGKEKIKEIADECVKIARADLSFLKKTLGAVENGKHLSAEELSELAGILGRNSYFRFLKEA
ncbi:hypothetical protein H0O02_00200 [Candidatus Micrarchaeota archaeon]|nr:hypothetical protein [Candidatus Micrarchaeota archaeon]